MHGTFAMRELKAKARIDGDLYRTLARGVAEAYFASREALGFPMLRGTCLVSEATETGGVPA